MKPVRLIIAAVLLAALGGALWWSNRDEKAKEGKPAADAPPFVLSIKPDEVKQLTIQRQGHDAITVVFNDKGKWDITAPKPYPADATAVAALTSGVFELPSERVIDPNVTDLAAYGLAPASLEVDVTNKGGRTSKLLIGENTPTGNAVYAKVEGDPRLFSMPAQRKTTFEKEVNDLRDKRLLVFSQDKLTTIAVRTPKGERELARNAEGEWRITKPQPMRADQDAGTGLMNKIREAVMDLSESDAAKTAGLFASAAPVGTATVTDESGPKTLEIRKNNNAYYAKSSTLNQIYKTSNDVGAEFEKSLEAYRNKKSFDFGFNDPTRIEVTDGAKNVILDKSNTGKDDKWLSAGKTMDTTSVQQFIDKLRDLTAAKFVSAGFTTPAFTVSVTSGGGKRKEKVEISEPSADHFIARHDGDAGLYELDAKAVKDLRQAVGDIREEQKAAAAKK